MNELETQFILFKLNDEVEDFEKIETVDTHLKDALDSRFIYLIVDSIDKNVWIWNGKKSNIRMKFIASQKASHTRDSYGNDYKISSVDEGDESHDFLDFINVI